MIHWAAHIAAAQRQGETDRPAYGEIAVIALLGDLPYAASSHPPARRIGSVTVMFIGSRPDCVLLTASLQWCHRFSGGLGGMEVDRSRRRSILFGAHVFDAHHQLVGTVVLVRDDEFVMRQQLGMDQLVAIPSVAVAGVVGGLVFLTLTPGEIELYGRTLERTERSSPDWGLLPRLVQPAAAV